MVTYFNKKDLISFGNYLLSDEREISFDIHHSELKAQGINTISAEQSLSFVHHSDVENWVESQKNNR
jgi:hypothetical protein